MTPRAAPSLAAVAAALGAGVASAAPAPEAIRGEVQAVAVSGSATVVARTLPGRGLVIERRAIGSPPRALLREGGRIDSVVMAASDDALAVSIGEQGENGPARTLVGPATGPLREVTRCAHGAFGGRAVSVVGRRVVWGEGGCAPESGRSFELTPGTLAIGDADPAQPVVRIALPEDRLAARIVPTSSAGFVGLFRPSFVFFVATEIRPFDATGVGDVILRTPGELTLPIGIPDGSAPIVTSESADEEGDDCPTISPLPSPGAAGRPIALLGCPSGGNDSVTVTADRVVARLELASERADRGRFTRTAIVSVRPDGTGRRTLVRGTYRGPDALAAGDGRVVWSQPRCAGATELASSVVAPATTRGSALASCTLQPLTRRALVRHGAITVRFRCPHGCAGTIVDDTRCGPRALRRFHSEGGTTSVRVRLGRRLRRADRALLRFNVDHGPQRLRAVRLRR